MAEILTPVLVKESKAAWEAGLQNCPGPISEEEAKRTLEAALLDYLFGGSEEDEAAAEDEYWATCAGREIDETDEQGMPYWHGPGGPK